MSGWPTFYLTAQQPQYISVSPSRSWSHIHSNQATKDARHDFLISCPSSNVAVDIVFGISAQATMRSVGAIPGTSLLYFISAVNLSSASHARLFAPFLSRRVLPALGPRVVSDKASSHAYNSLSGARLNVAPIMWQLPPPCQLQYSRNRVRLIILLHNSCALLRRNA